MKNASNTAEVGAATGKVTANETGLVGLSALIDILLVYGALFSFGYCLTIWGIKPNFENLYMIWALGVILSAATILVSTIWSTGPLSRTIVRVCCSIYLLSLNFLFYLCTVHPELWENHRLRMLFVGCAAWAVICIGLLCIEQRLLKKCSPTTAARPSTWAEKLAKFFSAIFAPAATAVYIATIVLHGPHFIEEFSGAAWPRIAATVDDARTSTTPLYYGQPEHLEIAYHFSVDEKIYYGSYIAAIGAQSHYSYGNMKEKAKQIESDNVIQIAYDPNDPNRSMALPCSFNFLVLAVWDTLFYLVLGVNSFVFLAQQHRKTLVSYTGEPDLPRWYYQVMVVGTLGGVGAILFSLFKCISLSFDSSGLILVLLIGAAYRIDRMLAKPKPIPQVV